MLQNPMVQQMMQNLASWRESLETRTFKRALSFANKASNPQLMQQMIQNNPMLQVWGTLTLCHTLDTLRTPFHGLAEE